MATLSSVLTWEIPCTEELGGTEVKPVGSEGHHSCNITVRLPHVVNRTLVSSCCENSVNTHNSNLVCYTSRR